MPTIPNGMEPIISQGYSYRGPDGAMRTPVSGGMPRYGLDYDRGTSQFNVALILDRLQWQVWESFYLITIKKGSLPFDMLLDSGLGAAMHTVHIVPDSYSANLQLITHASIAFVVECESQIYANPDAGTSVIDLYNSYGQNSHALLDALYYFANVSSDALDY